jgi:hypothetical protein
MTNLDQRYFENLVSGAVRMKHAADVRPIALICLEAHQRAKPVAAWHAAAQFYGYLDRCNCFPCKSKREAA